MIEQAIESGDTLEREGIGVSLFVVTSPDLLYRQMNAAWLDEQAGQDAVRWDPTGLLNESEIGKPVLSVIDGHPHSISFLGTALDSPSRHSV